MARWRSLHEVATVAQFLSGNADGDDALAERYLLHVHVEEWNAAREYAKHCAKLGLEPLTPEEYAARKEAFDELIGRFGKPYGTQYGWAAAKLGMKHPKIADIEAAVGLEYLRPHYRVASHSVHANPRGIFAHLGFFEESVLLAGPSNMGWDNSPEPLIPDWRTRFQPQRCRVSKPYCWPEYRHRYRFQGSRGYVGWQARDGS